MNVCCMAGGHHHPLTKHVSVFVHSWCGHATLPTPLPIATAKWPKRTHSFDFGILPSGPSKPFAHCNCQVHTNLGDVFEIYTASTHKYGTSTVQVRYKYGLLFVFLHASCFFLSGIQACIFGGRHPGLRFFVAGIQASVCSQASRHQASVFIACIQASPFQGWGG